MGDIVEVAVVAMRNATTVVIVTLLLCVVSVSQTYQNAGFVSAVKKQTDAVQ